MEEVDDRKLFAALYVVLCVLRATGYQQISYHNLRPYICKAWQFS